MKLLFSSAFTVVCTLGTLLQPISAQDIEDDAALQAASKPSQIRFKLFPDPAMLACVADSSGQTPTATVSVFRGTVNDHLFLTLDHFKPHLAFDMFTVQRSKLRSDGSVDPAFKDIFKGSFGFAWYQSDVEANNVGHTNVDIKTILLDQIFGFDPDKAVPPTNTFHVGIWFNNPKDAAACGFDVTKPTPFNGEHKAGPVAFISVPNATTGLGPLCTDPDPNHPGACNP